MNAAEVMTQVYHEAQDPFCHSSCNFAVKPVLVLSIEVGRHGLAADAAAGIRVSGS